MSYLNKPNNTNLVLDCRIWSLLQHHFVKVGPGDGIAKEVESLVRNSKPPERSCRIPLDRLVYHVG